MGCQYGIISIKISISRFKFQLKFGFLIKIWKFDLNFNFGSKFDYTNLVNKKRLIEIWIRPEVLHFDEHFEF